MTGAALHPDFKPMPEWLGVAFVALTTVIMAYSALISVVPILVLYGLWFSQIIFHKPFVLRPGRDMVLPALFAFYNLFTIFWSDHPRGTLIIGLEFVSMIMCIVIIARIVALETMVKGVAIGTFLVLAALFHTGQFSFDGLFGSKNMVGLYAEIAIFIGVVLLFHLRRKFWELMMFAVPPLALGLVCLALSHSASSLASLLIVLAVCAAAVVMGVFPRGLRPVFFGVAGLGVATIVVFLAAYHIDLQAEILHALGKNPTLTGRTVLWAEGLRIGMDAPLLGHGYAAFWVTGQPDAERLAAMFGIPGAGRFHFHSMFVQAFVDLGLIGLFLLSLMVFGSAVLAVMNIIRDGVRLETMFMLGIAAMFLIRAFVEVDFNGPFGIGVFLFYWATVRLFSQKDGEKTELLS